MTLALSDNVSAKGYRPVAEKRSGRMQRHDINRMNPGSNQELAQRLYSLYMEKDFNTLPQDNEHYGNICKKVYERLIKVTDISKKTLYFLGATPFDLERGGLQLDYQEGERKKMGDIIACAQNLVFHSISRSDLQKVYEKLEQKWRKKKDVPENICLLADDISGGADGFLMEFFDDQGEASKSVEEILIKMRGIWSNTASCVSHNGHYDDERIPFADIGFSLMVQNATIVPVRKALWKILERDFPLKTSDKEKRTQVEESIFNFMKEYNLWLFKSSLKSWFRKSPNGELIIFMDTGTEHYERENGEILYGKVDKTRVYRNIEPNYENDLARIGLSAQKRKSWSWKDDNDHQHPVEVVTVQKEV